MIGIVGTPLNQWDVGRSVTVAGITADRVHFANKGDSKAVIMELVDGQAKIPDYLLQSGKQICAYVVANGVTVESKTFYVIQRERPENYVYKDDQRNYIYELIQSAEDATETAKQATQNALEAADKANQAAKSWVIMGEMKGESMVIDDAIDQTFAGFRIFGKTTQDGVPSPDAPVDLVSIENPTVTVNEQAMLVPYTLRGIPVASGGNYTDSNGQQWICDEVDFARGVYVQRIGSVNMGTLSWYLYKDNIFYSGDTIMPTRDGMNIDVDLLCSIYVADKKASDWQYVSTNGIMLRKGAVMPNFYSVCVKDTRYAATSDFQDAVMGVPLHYIFATPIETPLSEEELAAYAALHTSRYGTTVSNEQNAYMDIHYVMDAKKYIDSLIRTGGSSGLINATVE